MEDEPLKYTAGEKWRKRLEANERRIKELERLVDVMDEKIKQIQPPSRGVYVVTVLPIVILIAAMLWMHLGAVE